MTRLSPFWTSVLQKKVWYLLLHLSAAVLTDSSDISPTCYSVFVHPRNCILWCSLLFIYVFKPASARPHMFDPCCARSIVQETNLRWDRVFRLPPCEAPISVTLQPHSAPPKVLLSLTRTLASRLMVSDVYQVSDRVSSCQVIRTFTGCPRV